MHPRLLGQFPFSRWALFSLIFHQNTEHCFWAEHCSAQKISRQLTNFFITAQKISMQLRNYLLLLGKFLSSSEFFTAAQKISMQLRIFLLPLRNFLSNSEIFYWPLGKFLGSSQIFYCRSQNFYATQKFFTAAQKISRQLTNFLLPLRKSLCNSEIC